MRTSVVFGAPGSGTTFVMVALDAMSATECVQGQLFAPAIPQIYEHESSPHLRGALLTAFDTSIREYLSSGMYNARAAALRKWVAARDGIRGLSAAVRGERHAERFVYKEPFLAFSPSYAYEALPNARLVYIYRDGRDVADSLVRRYDILTDAKLRALNTNEMPLGRLWDDRYVPWWVDECDDEAFLAASDYVRAIWMWRAMVRRCNEFLSQPHVAGSRRVLHTRYEDLVRDPVAVGRQIADHVGGPLTKPMRRRLERAHPKSIGIHRRRDPGEVRRAEEVAGSELELLGYATASAHAAASASLRAAAA